MLSCDSHCPPCPSPFPPEAGQTDWAFTPRTALCRVAGAAQKGVRRGRAAGSLQGQVSQNPTMLPATLRGLCAQFPNLLHTLPARWEGEARTPSQQLGVLRAQTIFTPRARACGGERVLN